MNTSSGNQKSSAYLTFRVMAEGSTGWIVPAKPAQWVARSIAQQADKTFGDRISQALAGVGV